LSIGELIELLKERTMPHLNQIDMLRETIWTFRVLLYFPLEYFSFQVLNGFVRCAVVVDEALLGRPDGPEESMNSLAVLRIFLRRVCLYVGGGGVLDFGVSFLLSFFFSLLKAT
jgi:hypothetical protein